MLGHSNEILAAIKTKQAWYQLKNPTQAALLNRWAKQYGWQIRWSKLNSIVFRVNHSNSCHIFKCKEIASSNLWSKEIAGCKYKLSNLQEVYYLIRYWSE